MPLIKRIDKGAYALDPDNLTTAEKARRLSAAEVDGNFDQLQTNIDTAFAGIASRIATPVQDLAALKALNTTSATTWPDKILILAEDLGQYRLDRNSSATNDDNGVVQPTAGVGRWIKLQVSTSGLDANGVRAVQATGVDFTDLTAPTATSTILQFLGKLWGNVLALTALKSDKAIIVTTPATIGNIALTFDVKKNYSAFNQSGSLTISYTGSLIESVEISMIIDGNGVNGLTIDPDWINVNEILFDTTKRNIIFFKVSGGKILYNIILVAIPVVDTFAPVITLAETSTDGSKVILYYNKSLIGTPNYTLAGKTISSQVVAGITVELTVTIAYVTGNTPTVSGGGVTNRDGYGVSVLSSYPVNNNVDVTPPVFQSAAVFNDAPNTLKLVYDKNLNTSSIPSTSDFVVSGKVVSSISILGKIVTVSFTTNFAYTDSIAISYTPGTNKIKDTVGNLAVALTSQAVTNNTQIVHKSTFTAANGTLLNQYIPEIGNYFSDIQGSWEIQGNRIIGKTFPGNFACAVTNLGKSNFIATIVGKRQNATDIIAIYPRFTDINNCLALNIGNGTSGGVQWYNGVTGTFIAFGTISGIAPNGSDITIEITFNGTTIGLKINGTSYGNVTAPTTQAGQKFGFLSNSTAVPANSSVDSLIITEL